MPRPAILLLCAALLATGPAAGDTLPPLRWGADQAGGGPYIYEGPDGRLTGFEVELAGLLAARMGRRAEFVQGPWDKLPQLLDRGEIDLVLNGYEWSAEREACWASTVPYYVYGLQLLVRRDGPVRGWEDLAAGGKVGVLGGSAAERLARERLPRCEILAFDGVTNALRLLEQGQLDASLQDTPVAVHYLKEFPGVVPSGSPEAPGWYVGFVRREDAALREALDAALAACLRDGSLRALYARYGLWDARQEGLAALADAWPPPSALGSEGFADRFGRALLEGAWMTLRLSCLAMPLAMLLGLGVALGRQYGPRWLAWPLGVYVEVLRGTPVLLQLFVIYYILPGVGIRIPAFWAGVIGLGINYSAYEAENYRAGLMAVPKGQMEAALALGMGPRTALRRVVVPQALRLVVPPVTNDFIALFKDTSVCSVIAVSELTGIYNRLYNNHPRLALELGLAAAALYLLMSYPLAVLARRLEHRRKAATR